MAGDLNAVLILEWLVAGDPKPPGTSLLSSKQIGVEDARRDLPRHDLRPVFDWSLFTCAYTLSLVT